MAHDETQNRDNYAAVLEDIATLSTDHDGNKKMLRRVRWRHGAVKLDVRTWLDDGSKDGRPGRGVTLNGDEAKALRDALTAFFQKHSDTRPE